MKKINKFQFILPGLLLADPPWLAGHGYSGVQLNKYAASGWLQKPARWAWLDGWVGRADGMAWG